MLSHTERKLVRDMELTHGVIITTTPERSLEARHWKTDDLIAEADSVAEMGVVLKSLHVYPDDDYEGPSL